MIGCGGSATTDGGWGAVEVVGSAATLAGIELEVASDVTTHFVERRQPVFGPQKGASAEQVALLTERLRSLADRYRRDFGVDVDTIPKAPVPQEGWPGASWRWGPRSSRASTWSPT